MSDTCQRFLMSASTFAEQQELAGCGGPDGPAAHRSRSGIRQGGTAELPLQRFPAGEMSVGFSPPTASESFFLFAHFSCTKRTDCADGSVRSVILKNLAEQLMKYSLTGCDWTNFHAESAISCVSLHFDLHNEKLWMETQKFQKKTSLKRF